MLLNKLRTPLGRIGVLFYRYHFGLAIIILLALLAGETLFLYRFFWIPLTQSRALFEMRQQEKLETLKMPLYEKILEFHTQKQQSAPLDWSTLRDPFETD